jgi:hypothetical protein
MGRWCLVVLLIGCGEPAGSGPDAFTPTFEPMTVTVRLTDIAREDSEGRMRGVDLDGRVSDATDELGCLREDWTDPLGDEPGVDNQYYGLVISNEAIGPARPPGEPTIDEMIRDAAITVPLSLTPAPGGVEVRLGDAESQVVPFEEGHFQAVTDGALPMSLGGLTFTMVGLAIDGVITADGALTSLIVAGGLDAEEIVGSIEANMPDIDSSLIRATLEGVVDLEPGDDGLCTRMSAVFTATVEP